MTILGDIGECCCFALLYFSCLCVKGGDRTKTLSSNKTYKKYFLTEYLPDSKFGIWECVPQIFMEFLTAVHPGGAC